LPRRRTGSPFCARGWVELLREASVMAGGRGPVCVVHDTPPVIEHLLRRLNWARLASRRLPATQLVLRERAAGWDAFGSRLSTWAGSGPVRRRSVDPTQPASSRSGRARPPPAPALRVGADRVLRSRYGSALTLRKRSRPAGLGANVHGLLLPRLRV